MSATTHRYRAYIALGSNQGVSAEALNGALTELDALAETQVQKVSPWYRSEAIGGPANQPDFLNAVCEIATGLEPQPLLQALHRIEHHFGRERQIRWGPRTLDLDIVWYEGVTSTDPELTLPHPRAHERAFVVRPLMDIAPDLTLHGETIAHWLKQTENQSISRR